MLVFLLPFIFGAGVQSAETYLRYPSGPLEPLAFDERRVAPWPADYASAGSFSIPPSGGWIAAPQASDYQTSGQLLAQITNEQLEQENLELRQRIEALENMLKQQVGQPPVPQPMPQPSAGGTKAVAGWLVEVHDWNSSGRLGEDPLERVLTRSCPFRGDFRHQSDNGLYIYHFSSVYRAKAPGRYVFGFDMTCNRSHACVMELSVDGQRIIDLEGERDAGIVRQGIPLTVGDHRIEFKTYLTKNRFLKYDPAGRYKWEPLVQGPGEFNLRDFRTDELFAIVPQSVNAPVLGCNY